MLVSIWVRWYVLVSSLGETQSTDKSQAQVDEIGWSNQIQLVYGWILIRNEKREKEETYFMKICYGLIFFLLLLLAIKMPITFFILYVFVSCSDGEILSLDSEKWSRKHWLNAVQVGDYENRAILCVWLPGMCLTLSMVIFVSLTIIVMTYRKNGVPQQQILLRRIL